jgi:hypothetical protein
MARRSIWTRAKHRVGLERPHFWTRFRGQSESWVAPAQQEVSFGGWQEFGQRVKKVGTTYFSFVFTTFFTL